MSGGAIAGAAAAAGNGSGRYDRARMSKVHDELRAESDAAKIVTGSASRRTNDLSTSQLTFSVQVRSGLSVRNSSDSEDQKEKTRRGGKYKAPRGVRAHWLTLTPQVMHGMKATCACICGSHS